MLCDMFHVGAQLESRVVTLMFYTKTSRFYDMLKFNFEFGLVASKLCPIYDVCIVSVQLWIESSDLGVVPYMLYDMLKFNFEFRVVTLRLYTKFVV